MQFLFLLIIFVLLIIAGLFSAAETAITASSPGKIHKLLLKNPKNAQVISQILKQKEKVISSLLIGNSILNTVCISFATSVFIDLLGDARIGAIVSSGVMACLLIIFAEVIPKAITVSNAEQFTLIGAPAINFFLKILSPVNYLIDKILRFTSFVSGIDLNPKISGSEEVRGIIEHHHKEGNVYKADKDMLEGVLNIRDMHVSEIMIHRSDVDSINLDLSNQDLIKSALDSLHSRILFWQNNKDNIVGILHIKDLIKSLNENNHEINKMNISSLLTPPWFIPEDISVISQLNAFREKKKHLACVIDEYGDFQGIVTLEDILEEIVGQINDEHDVNNQDIIKKSDTEFIIGGSTTIRDINRELNWNLPDDNANTIAGLIIYEIKHIPQQGQEINIFNLKIEIVKKIKNKIEFVKVKILPNSQNTVQ